MNYYEKAAKELKERRIEDIYGDRTKIALDNAVKKDPVQHITERNIAQQINVDPGYVQRNMDQAKILSRQASVDIPKLKKVSPKTHEWLADQNNANVAWDDVGILSQLEEAHSGELGSLVVAGAKETAAAFKLQGIRVATERLSSLEDTISGLKGATTTIGRTGTSAISGLPIDKYNRNLIDFQGLPVGTSQEALQASIDAIKGKKFTTDKARRTAARAMMRLADEASDVKYSEGVQIAMEAKGFKDTLSKVMDHPLDFILEVSARSAAPSLASLPSGIVGAAAAGPIGFGVGIGAGSASVDFINEFRGNLDDAGVDVTNVDSVLTALENEPLMDDISTKSAIHAGFVGAFDGITAGMAGKFLAPAKLKGTIAGELVNMFGQTALQGLGGGAGEISGTLAKGDDISWPEVLAEVFGETVTVPVDVVTARSTAAGRKTEVLVKELEAMQRTRQNIDQTTAGKKVLDSVAGAAKKSKLRTNDQESFRSYAKNVTVDEEISISASDIGDFFQSTPEAEQQILERNPALYRSIRESMDTGSDIIITKADYLTDMVDYHSQLSDIIRVDGNELNNAEAIAAADELDKAMKDKADNIAKDEPDKFQESADNVYNYMVSQIASTGRFTPDTAKQDAELHRAFAIVRAKQLGIMPEQVYERYGLQVTGGKIEGGLSQSKQYADGKNRIDIDGEDVGYINLDDGGDYLRIADIELKPMHQGKGIGSDAIKGIMAQAQDRGIPVVLTSDSMRGKEQRKRQRALYERLGFKKNKSLKTGGVREEYIWQPSAKPLYQTAEPLVLPTDSKEEIIRKYDSLPPTHSDKGNDYAISTTELQDILDKAGDGFLYRVTLPEYVTSGKDKPAYEHRYKNGDVKKSISYTSNINDAIAYAGFRSSGVDGRPVEDFIIYRVRPDSIPEHDMRLLIPSDKIEGKLTLHLHSFAEVSTTDIALEGKTLAKEVEKVQGEDEGGFYDIQEEEVDALLAELSSSLGFELIGEEEGFADFGAGITLEPIEADTGAAEEGMGAGGELQQGGEPPLRFILTEDDIEFYQKKRGSIQFGDTATISLLETADLSTFLHETGHFFLETTARMAAAPDAPQSIKDDMQLILDDIGEKDVNAWLAKPIDERRSGHEKIADAFEKYLMEGKAPSARLKEAFNRYRAWILDVYSRLRGLDVELTDEVRGVFDRMLATQEEIDAANELQGVYPIFENAEEAGMTKAKFERYRQSFIDHEVDAIAEHQARSMRDMKYLDNAMSKAMKALQREGAAARKAVRDEVREEVIRRKEFMARSFLEKGTLPGGLPEGLEAHKLNRKDIEDMTGDADMWKQLPRGATVASGGVHPDVTAGLFGFNNGLEMVNAIIRAGRPEDEIATVTDRRMLERYGDMYSDEQIKNAAMQAVQNKARSKILSTELDALNKRAGRASVPLSAVKAYAETFISRAKVPAAIKFNPFLQAERRAGKESAAAFKKGDIGPAAVLKRNQILQQHLYRESYKASQEVEKILRYLKKFTKKSIRQKLDAEYLDQIDAILERYNLKNVSQGT